MMTGDATKKTFMSV